MVIAMSPKPPSPPRFSLESGRERGFERVLKWGVLAVVVAGLVWTIPHWPNAWRWVNGREMLYVPEHDPNLDAVELEQVHRELWTKFLVAAARATPGSDDERLNEARKTMRTAIGADENLTEIFDELDGIVTTDRLEGAGAQRRALWLTRAWNHYLDLEGQPYFLHGHITEDRLPIFYAHMYKVVADASATVGEEELRVRAVSRLDRINLREPYLGYASNADESAIVLSDRIMELAIDRVWPLLGSTSRDRLDQIFRPMVVAELRRAMPGETLALLTKAAALRSTLVETRKSILGRRCSYLWIPRPPAIGYTRDELDRLSEFVGEGPCAGVTGEELNTLWKTSEKLQGFEGLDEAAERLAAWVARSIAIHELRLAADELLLDPREPRKCGPCTSGDAREVRSQAAAYMAELAWADAPATALYRICITSAFLGPHARAREIVTQALGGSCREGAPPELTESARALATKEFGNSETIVLGADFPERLPVVPARDQQPERNPDAG